MPEVRGDHLDVSAEEMRFLRRSFRRFALPYLIAGIALGALAGAGAARVAGAPPPPVPSDDPRLRGEVTDLRSEVAALSQRVVGSESALAKTRDRLVALEGRGGASAEVRAEDAADLAQRLDASTRRIESLEQRIASGQLPAADGARLEEWVATLGSRMARVEAELRSGREAAAPAKQAD